MSAMECFLSINAIDYNSTFEKVSPAKLTFNVRKSEPDLLHSLVKIHN